jgi:hypothetical protein
MGGEMSFGRKVQDRKTWRRKHLLDFLEYREKLARENFDLIDAKFRSPKPTVPLTRPLPVSTIKRMSSASQIRCQCCTCCCMCASTGARELLT